MKDILINIIIIIFGGFIMCHVLSSNKEYFDCDININDLETCFKRTQNQNGLKIKEAKTTQKTVAKILADVKKMAEKQEGKIATNRQGVIGLQENKE
jgi:Skp family chaperone for outer membrane proteins